MSPREDDRRFRFVLAVPPRPRPRRRPIPAGLLNPPAWLFRLLQSLGREPFLSAENLTYVRDYWAANQAGPQLGQQMLMWDAIIDVARRDGPLQPIPI